MFPFEISGFFEKNLTIVFLIYGFSFFLIAMSILLGFRSLKAIGLADAFLYLIFFSALHGTVEWMDMYLHYKLLIYNQGLGESAHQIRFYILAASFYFLLLFAIKSANKAGLNLWNRKRHTIVLSAFFLLAMLLLYLTGIVKTDTDKIEGAIRYLLGFPSSLLAGIAFYRLSRNDYRALLPKDYARHFKYISYAFIFYSATAGLVVPKSEILLSQFINQEMFVRYTGFPIPVLRGFAAIFAAYFLIKAMA